MMRKRPFLRILIPYMLGILIQNAGWSNLALWILTSLVVLFAFVVSIYRADRRFLLPGVFLFSVYLSLGVFSMKWSSAGYMPSHFGHFISPYKQEFSGVIKGVKQATKSTQIRVGIRSLVYGDSCISGLNGEVLLFLKRRGRQYLPGDEIRFSSRLSEPFTSPNPFSFDYRNYLKIHNIEYTGWVQENELEVVYRPHFHFKQWSYRIQSYCQSILKEYIRSSRLNAIATALILGDKSMVTPELRRLFSQTGAMHILAVSGLHVGIIFILLQVLLSFFPKYPLLWQRLKMAIIVLGIWAFAFVTGMSQSTLRAGIMFSLIAMGLRFYRRSDIFNTLALSALMALLYSPKTLFHVGFQLSYLATLGIVFFYPRLESALFQDSSIWKKRIGAGLLVGITAQLFTYPLMLYYFHTFSWAFLLSNFVVIPLAFVILASGWTMIILHSISYNLAGQMALLLQGFLGLLYYLLEYIRHIPRLLVEHIWITPLQLMILTAATLLIVSVFVFKKRYWLIAAFSLLTIVHTLQYHFRWKQLRQSSIFFYATRRPLVEIWNKGFLYTYNADNSVELIQKTTAGTHAYYGRSPIMLTPSDCYSSPDKTFCIRGPMMQCDNMYLLWLDMTISHIPKTTNTLVIANDIGPDHPAAKTHENIRQIILYDAILSKDITSAWLRKAKRENWEVHRINKTTSWQFHT